MAKKAAPKKAVPALDVKALSAELGATVKEGRVSKLRDRYFVTVGKTKLEIPATKTVPQKEIAQWVGQSVPVLVAGSHIIAVGRVQGPRCYLILCYVPAPNLITIIQEAMRNAAVNELVKAGKIQEALGETIKQARGSVELMTPAAG